jgi:hypothetical protein
VLVWILAAAGVGEAPWHPPLAVAQAITPAFEGIDWARLRNPILYDPDRCLKDPSVVYHDGWFYVFSNRNYRTRDLQTYELLKATGSQPDVTWNGTQWIMAHNGGPLEGWAPGTSTPRLRTAATLPTWSLPQQLLPGLSEARNLDPALAWEGAYVYIAFKREQTLYLTRVAQGALGTTAWEPLQQGSLGGAWGEQFQMLKLDGRWHMLATGRRTSLLEMLCLAWYPYTCNHHPFLYTKTYSGAALAAWTRWGNRRELRVPQEEWNSAMHANGAFLADWRPHDGYFYLFYAGAADHESFNRRGHCKIGVARSRDLLSWVVPGP